MSSSQKTFHVAIDRDRQGHAGVHDLIDGENINRTLKKLEVLSKFDSVYLPAPGHHVRGKHKMLLVQGPHDERSGTALFPLGLGYIARILTDIGVHVEVLDAHAEKLSPDETLASLERRDFDLLGITALSTQYGLVKWLAQEVKRRRPDVKIIVGGQLAHYNPHTVIDHSPVDACVIGEGEITIQDIIYNLDDLSGVPGIAYRAPDGSYKRNADRPRIFNAEAIPFPYWDAFKMEYYFTTGFFGSRARRAVNVLSSRGCPYSCTFCSLSFPNITYRSVDNVVAEIRHLKEHHGVNGIMFADELFVVDKKRVYEFCEKIGPLGISWGGQGRANIVNDDEKLLRTMKAAGAAYIGYGLESATSDLLTKMQKKTTVEQNINCVTTAQKVGLVVVAQYMFGFPGETLASIRDGIEYFKKVHYCPPLGAQAACHISLTTPLPGSQLYEDCRKSGMITDEDEYLSRISTGFFHNEEVVVNLTSFSDEELVALRHATQEIMTENHRQWLKSQGLLHAVRNALHTLAEIWYYEGAAAVARIVVERIVQSLRGIVRGGFSALSPWSVLYPRSSLKTDYVYRSTKMEEFRRLLKQ